MVKLSYNWLRYQKNDYIGPVGSYDFHFISGAPAERNKYLALVRPFDLYTWAFIIASVAAVTVSLIVIEKLQAKWTKQPSNDTVFQCKTENEILSQVPSIILFLQAFHLLWAPLLMRLRVYILAKIMS